MEIADINSGTPGGKDGEPSCTARGLSPELLLDVRMSALCCFIGLPDLVAGSSPLLHLSLPPSCLIKNTDPGCIQGKATKDLDIARSIKLQKAEIRKHERKGDAESK